MRRLACLITVIFFLSTVSAQKEKIIPPADNYNAFSCGYPGTASSFPGGNGAWLKYIEKHNRLNSIYQTLSAPVTKWTAHVVFIIDAKGSIEITEIRTATAINQLFVAELRRLFEHAPKWSPEKYHGRSIRSYRIQPVTFDPGEIVAKRSDGTEE